MLTKRSHKRNQNAFLAAVTFTEREPQPEFCTPIIIRLRATRTTLNVFEIDRA